MVAGKNKPATLMAGQRIIPYKMFNGIWIPNVLLESALLSPTDMIVYGRLCQFGGENGICYPSLTTIATKTSISRSGAIKSINTLVEKGFLEKHVPDRTAMGRQCTNRYYFLLHPIFLDAFKPPSAQNELGSRPSTQSELGLVHFVDQPSSQNGPKEIHKENLERTTTTTTSLRFAGVSAAEACCGSGFSLSEFQNRYIDLKVARAEAEGEIRKSPGRYKHSLVVAAKNGELDMSDFEELVRWDEERQHRAPPYPEIKHLQKNKDCLFEKITQETVEAEKWFTDLPDNHPAKLEEIKPFMSESVWIRNQYKKYNNQEGLST